MTANGRRGEFARHARRAGGAPLVVLDVGTTSTRAAVVAADGTTLGEAREANALDVSPGRAEQDPERLLAAAERVIGRAVVDAGLAGEALALVISTHMHSLLVTDDAGTPRTPLLTWADGRAAAAARAVRSRPGWHELYARTGCPPHPTYPLYKLIALRDVDDAPRRHDRIHDLKSWLLWHWTGRDVVDLSIASGSGLLNLARLGWDEGALELAGVNADQLPELVDTTAVLALAADRFGLPRGTPVVVGAGDGVLSSLGSGAHEPGAVAVMVGTSGAVRVGAPAPVADPAGRLFSYYLASGRWIVGGALSNGGVVLDWLGRIIGLDPAAALAAAADAPAGAAGVVALPFVAGERAPGYDALARAAWFGLGLEHDRRHVARSAVEGIGYGVRSVLEPAGEMMRLGTVRATGGLARSELWLEVLAGVIDRPVEVPSDVEGSTIGAFVLGSSALAGHSRLDTSGVVRVERVVVPRTTDRAAYDEAYALYRRLYGALSPEFPTLAALRGATEATA